MRPIDADELINRVRDDIMDNQYRNGSLYNKHILDGLTFIAMINDSPTVNMDVLFEDDLK